MTPDQTLDQQSIESLHHEHVAAVNAGDLETVLSGMTDDVVYMAPGQAAIVGKKQLEEFLNPLYQQLKADISMTAKEVKVDGDWAFEWGDLEGEMRLGDGAAVLVDSKYLYVYRRQSDGTWKIARDIFNDNVSAK
jgi:uncharacterized protein (TIGR02246 family)